MAAAFAARSMAGCAMRAPASAVAKDVARRVGVWVKKTAGRGPQRKQSPATVAGRPNPAPEGVAARPATTPCPRREVARRVGRYKRRQQRRDAAARPAVQRTVRRMPLFSPRMRILHRMNSVDSHRMGHASRHSYADIQAGHIVACPPECSEPRAAAAASRPGIPAFRVAGSRRLSLYRSPALFACIRGAKRASFHAISPAEMATSMFRHAPRERMPRFYTRYTGRIAYSTVVSATEDRLERPARPDRGAGTHADTAMLFRAAPPFVARHERIETRTMQARRSIYAGRRQWQIVAAQAVTAPFRPPRGKMAVAKASQRNASMSATAEIQKPLKLSIPSARKPWRDAW